MKGGIDFGKTASDYGRHRAGFPERFFDRLFEARWVKKNDRVLDLGTGTGAWLMDVAVAGFEDIETFSFDEAVSYAHEAWRGRIRASAGVAASLPSDAVAKFDTDLTQLLARDYPDDPILVPHRVWALVARSPEAA
ncbi:MAG: hypothetical protein DLM53_11570 [Candidatus Eremiobacter antarcticus]|nr:hypothetical protein [Candidatus Eremiobacteraeota bacterium]MBC5809025.1 hypothetical protein [Candidatus Eremiobacteraeota bacterium]PZR60302.1 MAG: hypothetical protein DLM53_11570 [Candidatus Eremiobacter sp. RRmetagenome_bin22]